MLPTPPISCSIMPCRDSDSIWMEAEWRAKSFTMAWMHIASREGGPKWRIHKSSYWSSLFFPPNMNTFPPTMTCSVFCGWSIKPLATIGGDELPCCGIFFSQARLQRDGPETQNAHVRSSSTGVGWYWECLPVATAFSPYPKCAHRDGTCLGPSLQIPTCKSKAWSGGEKGFNRFVSISLPSHFHWVDKRYDLTAGRDLLSFHVRSMSRYLKEVNNRGRIGRRVWLSLTYIKFPQVIESCHRTCPTALQRKGVSAVVKLLIVYHTNTRTLLFRITTAEWPEGI